MHDHKTTMTALQIIEKNFLKPATQNKISLDGEQEFPHREERCQNTGLTTETKNAGSGKGKRTSPGLRQRKAQSGNGVQWSKSNASKQQSSPAEPETKKYEREPGDASGEAPQNPIEQGRRPLCRSGNRITQAKTWARGLEIDAETVRRRGETLVEAKPVPLENEYIKMDLEARASRTNTEAGEPVAGGRSSTGTPEAERALAHGLHPSGKRPGPAERTLLASRKLEAVEKSKTGSLPVSGRGEDERA
jgi:hypothetical protein